MAFKIVDYFFIEVFSGVFSSDGMILIRKKEHIEMLVCLDQCPRVLDGVLKVNIIVRGSMYQQQVAFQLAGQGEGRSILVAGIILLRGTHEALGIDGIVKTPIGDGRDGHPGAKDAVPAAHAHEHVITAVTPPPDTDAILVNIG